MVIPLATDHSLVLMRVLDRRPAVPLEVASSRLVGGIGKTSERVARYPRNHNSKCEIHHVMHASGNFCILEREDLNLEPQPRLAPEDTTVFCDNTALCDVICLYVAR